MKKALLAAVMVASSACVVRVPPYRHHGYHGHWRGAPAPRVEVVPVRPGPGHVWIGGYWDRRGGSWYWVPGVWVRHGRPHRGWWGG